MAKPKEFVDFKGTSAMKKKSKSPAVNPSTMPAKSSVEDQTLKNVAKSQSRSIASPQSSVTQPKYRRS